MTLLGRIISFYSTCVLSLCAATVLWFGWRPSPVQPVVLVVILYLVPPLTFRLHRIFFPIRKSLSNLSDRKYSLWWGAHQIQVIYTAIPQLEAALRLAPGLYSAWLRLWGSRIGRSVYWTPNVEITDRHALDIGDRVVCGHKCKFLGHAIKPRGREEERRLRRQRKAQVGKKGRSRARDNARARHIGASGSSPYPNQEVVGFSFQHSTSTSRSLDSPSRRNHRG